MTTFKVYEKATRSETLGELRAIKAYKELLELIKKCEYTTEWDKKYLDAYVNKRNTKHFFASLMVRLARLSTLSMEKLKFQDEEEFESIFRILKGWEESRSKD